MYQKTKLKDWVRNLMNQSLTASGPTERVEFTVIG
jgi:hypothetical protein